MTARRSAAPGLVAAIVAIMTVSGCSGAPQASDSAGASPPPMAAATPGAPPLPDPLDGFDYQLGGAYDPPAGVAVVERDRTEGPAGRGYDICYVNGFQTQPGESEAFLAEHPDLVARGEDGPLRDPGWPDELLFDTSTPRNRAELAELVGEWIGQCRASGYDAVEIDNLDSHTRSEGVLTAEDNAALAAAYATAAHDAGLAIAQKNTADMAEELKRAGYDFAVTESCSVFSECRAFTAVYPVVLDIEYTDELGAEAFPDACEDQGRPPAMILRDHDLVAPGDPAYHYDACRG